MRHLEKPMQQNGFSIPPHKDAILGILSWKVTLDLRPVSAADTDEACPVTIGHGGRAQQDVLKVAPSGILGIRLC